MSYKKKALILFSFLLVLTSSFAQDKFRFLQGQESHALQFKLINNLIVIPIEVNGHELNFLLDIFIDFSICTAKTVIQGNVPSKIILRHNFSINGLV